MKRRIYHILLSLPVLVVLLHSVTPHQHLALDETPTFIAQNHCSESFLSHIFEVDLGENHLEEFKISRYDVDFHPDLDLFVNADLDPVYSINYTEGHFFAVEDLDVQDLYLRGSHTLRAPPVA